MFPKVATGNHIANVAGPDHAIAEQFVEVPQGGTLEDDHLGVHTARAIEQFIFVVGERTDGNGAMASSCALPYNATKIVVVSVGHAERHGLDGGRLCHFPDSSNDQATIEAAAQRNYVIIA